MSDLSVKVDARPLVWGECQEFLDSPERGRSPRSKIVQGKEHDPDELVPETQRHILHHREWRHVQERTTAGKAYRVNWVHGRYVDAGHSTSRYKHAHFESWMLIVDDHGKFLDVPAHLCQPAG